MHWWITLLAPLWLAPAAPGVPRHVLPLDDALLLATDRGLYARDPEGWRSLLPQASAVVVADPRTPGGWIAAAGGGLYRGARDAAIEHVAVAPGATVLDLAADHERVWVATEAGLFASGSTGFAREHSLPPGSVQAVVAAPLGGVWVARDGTLWARRGGRFEARVRGLREGWWELRGAVDLPDRSTLLAVPSGLWRAVAGEPPRRIDAASGEIRAIARLGDALFIAAARGVLQLDLAELESAAPVLELGVEAFDVRAGRGDVVAATANGVARLRPRLEAAPALREAPPTASPSVLLRAVLGYQRLSPRHIDRIGDRVRDAAWLPQVRLSGGVDGSRSRVRDADQTFSTGAVRQLFDAVHDTDRGFGVDLQITWDLGKLADPDDAIAVSRERRELIELRDQVLERVNRLYFERERALARIDGAPAGERAEIDLRVRELTAALDAWSGGVFSRLESEPHPALERPGRQ